MMKYVSGKIIVLIMLVLLSTVVMRQTSAQFDCNPPGGGGGGDPTPTVTPACHDEYWDYYEAYCDYTAGFCCEDHYFVTDHYCYGVLEYRNVQLINHYCYEI